MQDGGARTMIVILDACRRNPVGRDSAAHSRRRPDRFDRKGLDQKRSGLIVYSTGLGETAADGEKEAGNSPFASILAGEDPVPDLPVRDLFDEVRLQMVDDFDQKPCRIGGMAGRSSPSSASRNGAFRRPFAEPGLRPEPLQPAPAGRPAPPAARRARRPSGPSRTGSPASRCSRARGRASSCSSVSTPRRWWPCWKLLASPVTARITAVDSGASDKSLTKERSILILSNGKLRR